MIHINLPLYCECCAVIYIYLPLYWKCRALIHIHFCSIGSAALLYTFICWEFRAQMLFHLLLYSSWGSALICSLIYCSAGCFLCSYTYIICCYVWVLDLPLYLSSLGGLCFQPCPCNVLNIGYKRRVLREPPSHHQQRPQ